MWGSKLAIGKRNCGRWRCFLNVSMLYDYNTPLSSISICLMFWLITLLESVKPKAKNAKQNTLIFISHFQIMTYTKQNFFLVVLD